MKWSKYCIYNSKDSYCYIYNTLTTAFVKVSDKDLAEINKSLDGNYILHPSCQKIIEYLLQIKMLVEDTYNELLPVIHQCFSKMYDGQTLHLTIAPTMKCNFDCFYCFEGSNKQFGEMSEEIEENLIRYIELHKDRKIIINWLGGEPLLAFNRILSISNQLNQKDIQFTSTIISNGSLFNDYAIDNLKALNLQHIQITLDGLKEVHDKRRVMHSGAPTFDIIINNIHKLLNCTDIPLRIVVNIDQTNKSSYKDIRYYFKTNFPKEILSKRIQIYHNYVLNRTDFDNNDNCFDASQILKDKIDEKTGSCGTGKTFGVPIPASPCMFRCMNSYAIDSKGNIYKCIEHLGQPHKRIGSLELGTLNKSELIQTAYQDMPFWDVECLECAYLPICLGGCPNDREKRQLNPSYSCCTPHKKTLEKLLPFLYDKIKSRSQS